ncbi:hypothetical protein [Syntrophotalea acetylenivorans]|uniref:hypothetical protein n=1 Tax=Syntrophotalea acetylenivorans TaxID=1842532 RepID=UPI0011AB415E|nr:hypothetical protein [Syntrophotalea acetylenivorans]
MPQQASDVTYWIAFTAGILSINQLGEVHPDAKVRLTVLLHTLCFIFGFSVNFIQLGAIASITSGQIQATRRLPLERTLEACPDFCLTAQP